VFASHTVVMAKGNGGRPARWAVASTTGVSRTAVVSRLRNAVVTAATPRKSANSAPLRPRANAVTRVATTSKNSARAASSASTITAPRKTSIGRTRPRVAIAWVVGSSRVATARTPATNSPNVIQSIGLIRRARAPGPEAVWVDRRTASPAACVGPRSPRQRRTRAADRPASEDRHPARRHDNGNGRRAGVGR